MYKEREKTKKKNNNQNDDCWFLRGRNYELEFWVIFHVHSLHYIFYLSKTCAINILVMSKISVFEVTVERAKFFEADKKRLLSSFKDLG